MYMYKTVTWCTFTCTAVSFLGNLCTGPQLELLIIATGGCTKLNGSLQAYKLRIVKLHALPGTKYMYTFVKKFFVPPKMTKISYTNIIHQ